MDKPIDNLVFIFDKAAVYSECFKPKEAKIYESFRLLQKTRFSRMIFRFLYKRFDTDFFFNPNLRDCGEKTILAFDTVDRRLMRWIRTNNPNTRIIVYFINTIRNGEKLDDFRKLNCEIWSFDQGDCDKFGLKFNQIGIAVFEGVGRKKKYDAVFVGREKTRRPILNKLATYMKNNDIKYYFHVTHQRNYPIINPLKYKHHISYKKMIEIEKASKAIIELVEPGQGGSTLRLLDCVFYQVKLITNYEPIIKSELYNPNNIFVFRDSLEGLKDFIEKPFVPYPESMLEKYSASSWIKRFGIQ